MKAILLFALIAWCSFFLARTIDLTNSDIGRHLKNGQLLLSGDKETQQKILHSNYYSYTHPDYPFVNHHWGAGILFYFVWSLFGFIGLSVVYIFCCLIGFLIMFFIAWRESSFWFAYSIAIIAAPLIGLRYEIRPEMITYLFAPIIFWILWSYRKQRIKYYWLFAIIPLMVIWVNFNLYFIFGLYLIGIFWLDSLLELRRAKISGNERSTILAHEKQTFLIIVAVASFIVTMINPWGIKGLFYPFFINSQINLSVFELASPFVLKLDKSIPCGFEGYFILLATLCTLIVLLSFKVFRKKFSFVVFAWSLTLIFLSIMQARNVAFFALFSIPLIAIMGNVVIKTFLKYIKNEGVKSNNSLKNQKLQKISLVVGVIFLFTLILCYNYYFITEKEGIRGIGLRKDNLDTLECFSENQVRGHIFNDFDISSYLIFGFYPQEKVFVDHRPEAYPPEFFEEYLRRSFDDEEYWSMVEQQYGLSAIVITNNPSYGIMQLFANRRIQDPKWDLVCKNKKAYVFRRN